MRHQLLINRFKLHCTSKGVHLLKDDERFISERLVTLEATIARRALKDYLDKWIEFDRKGLNGRFFANSFLREFTE